MNDNDEVSDGTPVSPQCTAEGPETQPEVCQVLILFPKIKGLSVTVKLDIYGSL